MITKTIDDLLQGDLTNFGNYSLCYVDEIPETVFGLDEFSKRLTSSKNFDWNNREFTSVLKYEDSPNPDFIPEISEMYAYFTPSNLFDQWGDDWDDKPYEHNSGIPYEDIKKGVEILRIPFYLDPNYTKYPSSYGSGNSPFSVEMINKGAIPWIFYDNKDLFGGLMAGEKVSNFIKFIKKYATSSKQ